MSPLQQRMGTATQLQCHRGPSLLAPTSLRRVRLNCHCAKDNKTVAEQKQSQSLSAPSKSTPQQLDRQQQQLPEEWRLFDFQAYQVPWNVPWSGKTVAATMATWLVGFAGTAFIVVPYLYTRFTGVPLWELGPSGQADFALWSEIIESGVTFGILAVVAARFPSEVKQQQLFNFSLTNPFKKGQGWLAWGLIGVSAAPIIVGATALAVTAVGYEQATSNTHGTVDGVASMLALDGPTYVKLLTVTGVLAPLLEETLFRGFLLTSLTKVMPNWAAVIASATAFGLAHLSLKDLPILIALGCWLGAIYCRSRNLWTPIIVHGAWNSTVLTLLFWLTANGVDVQQLLKDGGF